MMDPRSGPAGSWVGPPWFPVLITALVLTAICWSIDAARPGTVQGVAIMPILIGAAIAIHATIVRLVSGDPRLWRDPARLDRYMEREHPTWFARYAADPETRPRLLARVWREGTGTLAQQVGAVAGIGAVYAMSDEAGALLTLTVFLVVFTITGLLARQWLMAPDRAAMEPWLDADDEQVATPPV